MSPACRVVLVDDTEDLRMLLRIVLDAEADVEVVGEAADGAQGVELARSLRPDVVVLDIAMPVLDGLSALPLVREANPDGAVVMLSGFASRDIRAQADALGADAFLEKGAAVQELRATVLAAWRARTATLRG